MADADFPKPRVGSPAVATLNRDAGDSIAARLRAAAQTLPGRIVFTTSFGIEDQFIAHHIFTERLPIDVVTLDTGTIGWRPADLDRGFLPFLKGEGLANYFSDPAFQAKLAKPVAEDPGAAVMQWAQMFPNVGLAWDDLSFLRDNWDGPIVLKGITHVEDAKLAAEYGVDGIVVSNHGGRQVDGAIAALDALPPIADAVGEQLTVLFDSGVRTGADAAKALALGAKAVLLGRPLLYGLALAGQAGVEHVLRCFLADLDLTLALTGHATPQELTRDSLTRA